jgi:hypothetical protein
MSFLNVNHLKSIVVIVGVLAVCAPLAAQAPGGKSYEVLITTPPSTNAFCTCMVFDPNPPACLRFSPTGGLFLWAFDLQQEDGVQATTGVALPSICGGPRRGFEGIALHGTVDEAEGTISLEALFEVGIRRVLEGTEVEDCSEACEQP